MSSEVPVQRRESPTKPLFFTPIQLQQLGEYVTAVRHTLERKGVDTSGLRIYGWWEYMTNVGWRTETDGQLFTLLPFFYITQGGRHFQFYLEDDRAYWRSVGKLALTGAEWWAIKIVIEDAKWCWTCNNKAGIGEFSDLVHLLKQFQEKETQI